MVNLRHLPILGYPNWGYTRSSSLSCLWNRATLDIFMLSVLSWYSVPGIVLFQLRQSCYRALRANPGDFFAGRGLVGSGALCHVQTSRLSPIPLVFIYASSLEVNNTHHGAKTCHTLIRAVQGRVSRPVNLPGVQHYCNCNLNDHDLRMLTAALLGHETK